jgi:hypothetical protein
VQLAASLVSLSTNLAETLRATPRSGTPVCGANSTAALRREDVERIVRRTEQHFAPEIERLRSENAALAEQLQRASDRQFDPTVAALLQAEKRQRLECEEQSQRMIEEHAKQVLHLENRIRKLERQLQESTMGSSNRGTPRSSRNPARFDDEPDRTTNSPRAPTPKAFPVDLPRASTALPEVRPTEPLSTTAVNDFLQSIGRELDAINALEASRGQTLNAL